jgi:hypothetical protein
MLVDARTVHVPFAVAPSADEQTSQLPPHEELQQKPSTQLPEAHWRLVAQVFPCPLVAMQTPPEQ